MHKSVITKTIRRVHSTLFAAKYLMFVRSKLETKVNWNMWELVVSCCCCCCYSTWKKKMGKSKKINFGLSIKCFSLCLIYFGNPSYITSRENSPFRAPCFRSSFANFVSVHSMRVKKFFPHSPNRNLFLDSSVTRPLFANKQCVWASIRFASGQALATIFSWPLYGFFPIFLGILFYYNW